ncbi:MAG: hypothetical protein KatS3mg061_1845 [Dehalococcoidia bacterium]|nr:MAG: hypothetical protein KatS3mg061_1845 [Dehalococcoidia bacterium]
MEGAATGQATAAFAERHVGREQFSDIDPGFDLVDRGHGRPWPATDAPLTGRARAA